MPIYRMKYVEEKFPDLHKVIPYLVNRFGQKGAGKRLGVSGPTINKWLKENGYRKRTIYVRDENPKGAA